MADQEDTSGAEQRGAQQQTDAQDQAQPGQHQAQGQDPKDIAQRLVLAAMKAVFDPKVSAQLVQMLRSGDPVVAVSHAAVSIVMAMGEQAKGGTDEMAYAIAPVVVGFLIELGAAAGVFKADPAFAKEAIGETMQLLQQRDQQSNAQQQGGAQPQPGQVQQDQQAAPPAQPGGMIGRQMQGV